MQATHELPIRLQFNTSQPLQHQGLTMVQAGLKDKEEPLLQNLELLQNARRADLRHQIDSGASLEPRRFRLGASSLALQAHLSRPRTTGIVNHDSWHTWECHSFCSIPLLNSFHPGWKLINCFVLSTLPGGSVQCEHCTSHWRRISGCLAFTLVVKRDGTVGHVLVCCVLQCGSGVSIWSTICFGASVYRAECTLLPG
jgi:hypothetical protein